MVLAPYFVLFFSQKYQLKIDVLQIIMKNIYNRVSRDDLLFTGAGNRGSFNFIKGKIMRRTNVEAIM